MPLGTRKLELRGDSRPDSTLQLIAERAKDLFLSFGVSVHKYHEFVRRGIQSFKPRGLQESFSHFYAEGLSPRRDTYFNDGDALLPASGPQDEEENAARFRPKQGQRRPWPCRLTPEPFGFVELAEAEARSFQRLADGLRIVLGTHARAILIRVPHNTYSPWLIQEIE